MEENKIISTQITEVDELVDFEDMMFNPIRAEYNYRSKDGSIKTVYVYNPDEEQATKLMEIIKDNSTPKEDGVLDIQLSSFTMLRKILPIVTNYNYSNLTDEQINSIIAKPAPLLQNVMLDVYDIIKETIKLIYKLNKNTKEVLEDVMNLDENKMNELMEKTKEIQELTIQAEQEKQKSEEIKAKNNEEELKKILHDLQTEKTKNLELLAKLEENGVQTEKKKRGRKPGSKNKVKDVVESKEGETTNE